jgi:hypothetical protein
MCRVIEVLRDRIHCPLFLHGFKDNEILMPVSRGIRAVVCCTDTTLKEKNGLNTV